MADEKPTEKTTNKPTTKSLRLELISDSESVYNVELQYDAEKNIRGYWVKRKGDINQVLGYAVYLPRGLSKAFEKRAAILHQNGKLTDKSKIALIREYQDTGIESLIFVLKNKYLFRESRVVYIDPENGKMSHSGVILEVKTKKSKIS